MRLPVPATRLGRLWQAELRLYTVRSTSSWITLTSPLLVIVKGVELLELQVSVTVSAEVRGRRNVERRVDLGGESGHAAA